MFQVHSGVLNTKVVETAQMFIEITELQGNEWQTQLRLDNFEEHSSHRSEPLGRSHTSQVTFQSLVNLLQVLEKCN